MASIRFGVGVRDITPSFPVLLHGYGARDRFSGIHPDDTVSEPLSARALCLEGGDGSGGRARVVVLALDMLGVHDAEATRIRELVAGAAGILPEQVLLAGSHTHFAPIVSPQLMTSPDLGVVDPDPRYVAMVERACVEAVGEGFATLEAGALESYRVPVPSAVFNRRTIVRAAGAARTVETNFLYPEHPELFEISPVDAELTALRVTTQTGPRAVLMNFGCHPVTGGADKERSFYRISADYPLYARRTVEDAWRCPALFTLGAAGDAVPMNRAGRCREEIGAALGNAVLLGERVFAASGRSTGGQAKVATRTLALEVKTILPTAGTDAESAYRKAKAAFASVPEARRGEALREFELRARLAYRARLYPRDRHTVRVHLVRIGETVLVGMPFEVLSEISLSMKRVFPHAVLVSIANGYEGYLPPAYEYARGGYEATAESTHFEIGTADRILDLVLAELPAFL